MAVFLRLFPSIFLAKRGPFSCCSFNQPLIRGVPEGGGAPGDPPEGALPNLARFGPDLGGPRDPGFWAFSGRPILVTFSGSRDPPGMGWFWGAFLVGRWEITRIGFAGDPAGGTFLAGVRRNSFYSWLRDHDYKLFHTLSLKSHPWGCRVVMREVMFLNFTVILFMITEEKKSIKHDIEIMVK